MLHLRAFTETFCVRADYLSLWRFWDYLDPRNRSALHFCIGIACVTFALKVIRHKVAVGRRMFHDLDRTLPKWGGGFGGGWVFHDLTDVPTAPLWPTTTRTRQMMKPSSSGRSFTMNNFHDKCRTCYINAKMQRGSIARV